MRRTALVVVAFLMVTPAVHAQGGPDSENGRFTFGQVQEGFLRLDTRTGQVSLCGKRDMGWACQAVPDERSALESEIARLQRENANLKKEMIARGVPLPGGVKEEGISGRPQIELKLPSDADIDRLVAFMDKLWRRVIEMVQSIQKEIDKKS